MNDFVRKRIIAIKNIAPIIKQTQETKQSGIYLFQRTDENGIKFFYCGQAKNIFERIISHYNGWQRIDISIRKRKFKSDSNPFGWEFKILEYCPENELDEKENFYIIENLKQGKQTYNSTYGKQGKGRQTIIGNKEPKGYRDGLKQGYTNAQKEIAKLFETNLLVLIKGKETKNKIKAYNKFLEFLKRK